MSAAEKEPSARAMFGADEEAGPDEPEENEAEESDDDLRVLGEAAMAAYEAKDGLAYAKAIRDITGDREEE